MLQGRNLLRQRGRMFWSIRESALVKKCAAALNTVSYRQIAPPKPSLVKEPDISDMMPDWLKERKKRRRREPEGFFAACKRQQDPGFCI